MMSGFVSNVKRIQNPFEKEFGNLFGKRKRDFLFSLYIP
jgi:hypothetical protein